MSTTIHIANCIYLASYLVRDILWLRLLSIAGMVCLIRYYYCCSATPLYEAILWNFVFILVNLVQIGLLITERRPVFLGEDELRIYNQLFRSMKPKEFMRLLQIAEWKRANKGDILMHQDQPVDNLVLLSKGRGTVEVDGREVAEVVAGQFVGEMGFLTDKNASACVVATMPTEYLSWPVDQLRVLFANVPQLHLKLQGILGADLVEKLRREGFEAAHPSQIMRVRTEGSHSL